MGICEEKIMPNELSAFLELAKYPVASVDNFLPMTHTLKCEKGGSVPLCSLPQGHEI